jgi:hypothetical protein
MKTILIVIVAIGAFTTKAQSTYFKHDIGIRASSYNMERFRLDYRYHLSEKWTFSVGGYYGDQSHFSWNGAYLNDSTYESFTHQITLRAYGVTFGAQRKLNFMKHNFYYVGTDIGVGITNRKFTFSRFVFVPEGDQTSPSPFFPGIGEVLENEFEVSSNNAFNLNNRLFVGADVPIVDRLSFNLEVGMVVNLESANYNGYSTNYVDLLAFASGGLRYRFGKTE